MGEERVWHTSKHGGRFYELNIRVEKASRICSVSITHYQYDQSGPSSSFVLSKDRDYTEADIMDMLDGMYVSYFGEITRDDLPRGSDKIVLRKYEPRPVIAPEPESGTNPEENRPPFDLEEFLANYIVTDDHRLFGLGGEIKSDDHAWFAVAQDELESKCETINRYLVQNKRLPVMVVLQDVSEKDAASVARKASALLGNERCVVVVPVEAAPVPRRLDEVSFRHPLKTNIWLNPITGERYLTRICYAGYSHDGSEDYYSCETSV